MPRSKSKPNAAKGPSQRMLRVGELMRHKLSEMLSRGEIHDDDLAAHVITIPEVRMSPDLKLATAYVLPLGGDNADLVVAALERNKKYIRGEISRSVNLKYAPAIRFRPDESFEESMRIDALLAAAPAPQDLDEG